MSAGTVIIIGMATTTIACGVTSSIFNSIGRQTESMYMDIVCKSLLATTAITTFVKVIKALGTL